MSGWNDFDEAVGLGIGGEARRDEATALSLLAFALLLQMVGNGTSGEGEPRHEPETMVAQLELDKPGGKVPGSTTKAAEPGAFAWIDAQSTVQMSLCAVLDRDLDDDTVG